MMVQSQLAQADGQADMNEVLKDGIIPSGDDVTGLYWWGLYYQ
jgi:hypothetical protein